MTMTTSIGNCSIKSFLILFLLLIHVSINSALLSSSSSTTKTSFSSHHQSSLSSLSFITGANGYLGREIVHELLRQKKQTSSRSKKKIIVSQNDNDDLQKKHTIVCLVRKHRVEEETKYWQEYSTFNCDVLVHPYDMLDGGKSFQEALHDFNTVTENNNIDNNNNNKDKERTGDDEENCAAVIVYHVASVFGPTNDHKQTALDNVKGTEDLIHCLSKFRKQYKKSTKLIFTSSMAAVRGTGQMPDNGKYYTSDDWNTISQLGTDNWGSSYQWSKMESERRAFELTEKYNIPMISLCPSFIFGPSTDGKMLSNSYSIQLIKKWMRGENEVQSRLCVDVRDVAKAHVAAATTTTKNEDETKIEKELNNRRRYIISSESRLPSERIAKILMEFSTTPELVTYDDKFDGGAIKIGEQEVQSVEKLRIELGITVTPVDLSFRDMGKAIMEQQRQRRRQEETISAE